MRFETFWTHPVIEYLAPSSLANSASQPPHVRKSLAWDAPMSWRLSPWAWFKVMQFKTTTPPAAFSVVLDQNDKAWPDEAEPCGGGDRGISFVLTDLPAKALIRVADVGRERGLIFCNVAATDDRLRQEDCRANVIHVAPSRATLADGLGLPFTQSAPAYDVLVAADESQVFADQSAFSERGAILI